MLGLRWTVATRSSTAWTRITWRSLARQHGCVLRLCGPGGHLHGARVRISWKCTAARHRGRGSSLLALDCFAVRSLYQDPCYGVRQLVDIAIRAVSAAINDPTTAVQTLDRLHGILRAIADRPDPSGGLPRCGRCLPAWWCRCPTGTGCSTSPSQRSRSTGLGDPQISRKLMSIFDDLSSCVTPDRRGHDRLPAPVGLRNEVAGRHSLNVDEVLTADPLGLG